MGGATDGTIFIVDDDPTVCESLTDVLKHGGFAVDCFSDGQSFLEAVLARIPACILFDMHMPGYSGLEILRELDAEQYRAPIIMISGEGDIPLAVKAIRDGAFDFIEKPLDADDVLTRVKHAVDASGRRIKVSRDLTRQLNTHKKLTDRERDVLRYIATGGSNKETGRLLGISPRTVEVHRAKAMDKLGARNSADLIRILMSSRHR